MINIITLIIRIIIHNYVINITANATMDVKDLRYTALMYPSVKVREPAVSPLKA